MDKPIYQNVKSTYTPPSSERPVEEADWRFWSYRQNNSGGGFDRDENLDVHVIVQAKDADDANDRAQLLGVYFGGVDRGQDCECCGDRWGEAYGVGDEEPLVYGTPVEAHCAGEFGDVVIIHYRDGSKRRVEPLKPRR